MHGAQEKARASYDVLRRLGSGVNLMAAAQQSLGPTDYQGLSQRVGHVRLCGGIVEPLIDWSTCPGSTRSFRNDSHAVASLRAHHSFQKFKTAATEALHAGLGLVLNPLHKVFTLDVNADTLRWVWMLMVSEFGLDWPSDRVVFELANEPGNFNNHSCLLYTSPSPRDRQKSRMPSSA